MRRFGLTGLFLSVNSAEYSLPRHVVEIFSCYESELKEAPMLVLFL